MKNKWLVLISIGLVLGLLSGCNQVEDILTKVNLLLDEQAEHAATENVKAVAADQNGNSDQADKELANEQSTDGEFELGLPFDERLIAQGYQLNTLPNGFPFDVPYHWILVEEEQTAEGFESTFCFELPLEIEQIDDQFGYKDGDATLEYFLDKNNNTCVKATVVVNMEHGENYGEDPATMVSAEELALFEDVPIEEDRVRSLPSDYEQSLNRLRQNDGLYNEAGVLSIREKISSGELALLQLNSGFPRIIPYEWYLLEELDNPLSSSWSGTLCTDTSMNQAIIKHLDMLADYNADIDYLAVGDSLKPNVLTEVGFAFNDKYGTGSWHGVSLFFIAPDGEGTFPMHTCMTVDMEFDYETLE